MVPVGERTEAVLIGGPAHQWRLGVQDGTEELTVREMEFQGEQLLVLGYWPPDTDAGGATYQAQHRYRRDRSCEAGGSVPFRLIEEGA